MDLSIQSHDFPCISWICFWHLNRIFEFLALNIKNDFRYDSWYWHQFKWMCSMCSKIWSKVLVTIESADPSLRGSAPRKLLRMLLLFCFFASALQWLGFVWWLAGFQVSRCTKVNVAEGHPFSFLLMGSVGDVSAVFAVAVSHGLGTNPAAVLLFRKRSPSTFWLGFAWWLAGLQVFRCTKVNVAEGNSFSFLLVGSVGNVSAVFVVAVSHGLGTNPAAVLLFRKRSPSTFWLGFAWWLAGLQVFRCTKVNVAEGNSFSFLLVGSVGNVSAVFVVAVSHGLGTNPAAVLLFRKRSPSTFWLGFAWWLAGLQVFRCTKVNVAEGNSFSFLLVGSVGNVSAVFVVAVSHGLGTNPAAVLLFRQRSPSTFWLGFAWWLAGLQVFIAQRLMLLKAILFLSF